MAAELERCVTFVRSFADALAERRIPFPFGTAFFTDSLPKVWDLNYLRVERDCAADDLAAAAEELHAAAGHLHRRIAVVEGALGIRLRPGFETIGWEAAPEVIMALHRRPDRAANTSCVREVSEQELRPARERSMRAEPWGASDPEAVRQVLAAQERYGRATETRRFAALVDGEIASYCDLYTDGRTAQIEDVATLRRYRDRGLARAVVTYAAEDARAAGADLVFLVALEEDWPRKLYHRLGFDVVGRTHWFQLTSQTHLDRALRDLLEATGASRVTLRQDVPGEYAFPVTHEALAPGVASLGEERTVDLRTQPVVRELLERGQVVQDDCRAAFDDPAFHRMLETYGGLAAQVVTPIFQEGRLRAIVSLHQLGRPRSWTAEEIGLCSRTAERVGALL